MKAPIWLWGVVAAFAAFSVFSYGNARAAEALALARADSLNWAQERHDSIEVVRDSVRKQLAAAVEAKDRQRDSLAGLALSAERRSRVNLGRLRAILSDTTSAIPDTVEIIVLRAIEGLEEERNACRAQLGVCEATRLLFEGLLRVDSTSLVEKDSLLGAFDDQLQDALEHRRRPAGILRWLERGLAAYGILRAGGELLGGGR